MNLSSDKSIGGGKGNIINGSVANFIGGGNGNQITAAAASCSVIAGGNGNMISWAGNAILGGSGNNDGGLSGVMIVGNGITAVKPNTLHVNGLWANGIPFILGGIGALPGQIYWDVPPAPDVNAKALYIG